MHSAKHAVINAVLGAGLLYIFDMPLLSKELAVIVLFGFFVDVDHMFNQMWKGNLFNPKKMIHDWESHADGYTGEMYLFHSYEFIGLIGVIGAFFPLMRFALAGLIMHFIFDAIVNFRQTHTLGWLEDYSIIYYLYLTQDFPVLTRFFKVLFKLANPRVFVRLFAVYIFYIYAHPETFLGWFLVKVNPQALLKWVTEKLGI